jgi:hypothetical protein
VTWRTEGASDFAPRPLTGLHADRDCVPKLLTEVYRHHRLEQHVVDASWVDVMTMLDEVEEHKYLTKRLST